MQTEYPKVTTFRPAEQDLASGSSTGGDTLKTRWRSGKCINLRRQQGLIGDQMIRSKYAKALRAAHRDPQAELDQGGLSRSQTTINIEGCSARRSKKAATGRDQKGSPS